MGRVAMCSFNCSNIFHDNECIARLIFTTAKSNILSFAYLFIVYDNSSCSYYWLEHRKTILCCAIFLYQLTFFTIEPGELTIFFEKTLI